MRFVTRLNPPGCMRFRDLCNGDKFLELPAKESGMVWIKNMHNHAVSLVGTNRNFEGDAEILRVKTSDSITFYPDRD